MNHMEEPAFALRREKSAIVKSHVQSGDCLILKADTSITPDEKLTLYIHLTMTGLPEDSQFIEKIDVSKEFSLDDLKDIILSLPQLSFAKDYVSHPCSFLTLNTAIRANKTQRKARQYVLWKNLQRVIEDSEATLNSKPCSYSCAASIRARISRHKHYGDSYLQEISVHEYLLSQD